MERSVERRKFRGQTGQDERESRPSRKASFEESQAGERKTRSVAQLYGVAPVLEALRAGQRPIERVTLAEGAQHHRLRDLIELARAMKVPVHFAPRVDLARLV